MVVSFSALLIGAFALCSCGIANATLDNVDSDRVFAYHHAQGTASQKGQHSAHSASQIALPRMRFASQHTGIMSRMTQQVGASSASGKQVASHSAKQHHRHTTAASVHVGAQVIPGQGVVEPVNNAKTASGYEGDVQTSRTAAKLSSPLYGTFARNYGSVSQPLTESSGYGGFTANVDPTGFNFRHDDSTFGVQSPTSGFLGSTSLSETPGSSAYPARVKVKQATSVNGLSPLGITATTSDGAYTLMGPKSLGPYGVDGVNVGDGTNIVDRGLGLTVPPTGGNRFREVTSGIRSPNQQIQQIPAASLMASQPTPVQIVYVGNRDMATPSLTALTGRSLKDGGVANGIRLTYDPMMVAQRALYMQGGVNAYNTPGVVKQLGVSYPSPQFDRYSSVVPVSRMSRQINTSPLSNLVIGANIEAQQKANGLGASNLPPGGAAGAPAGAP